MDLNVLSSRVIACAIKIHVELGPGLLESAYQACLRYELIQDGLHVDKERPLPLVYKEIHLECGYRVDLLIERSLIVEVKSVETIHDLHVAQVLTYLKLSGCHLGLLINFNVPVLKQGVRRIIRT